MSKTDETRPETDLAAAIVAVEGHAGDISPRAAYALLEIDPDAVLIDVRTRAEWSYVGLPDLGALKRQPTLIEWQRFPDGEINTAFARELTTATGQCEAPVLFLCRSGVRSTAAARLATVQGYTRAYNVADGFEGPKDVHGHRGRVAGWKADGLPWVQG